MAQWQEDYSQHTAISDGGWSEPSPGFSGPLRTPSGTRSSSANPPDPFMTRYEYRVIKLYYAIFEAEAAIAALLNIEGDEGWYLCAVDGGFAFMRREVGPRSERELIERLEPR